MKSFKILILKRLKNYYEKRLCYYERHFFDMYPVFAAEKIKEITWRLDEINKRLAKYETIYLFK